MRLTLNTIIIYSCLLGFSLNTYANDNGESVNFKNSNHTSVLNSHVNNSVNLRINIEKEEFRKTKKNALQGNKYAKFELAILYKNGIGVEPSEAKYKYWLNKAAKDNVPEALINVSVALPYDKNNANKKLFYAKEAYRILNQYTLPSIRKDSFFYENHYKLLSMAAYNIGQIYSESNSVFINNEMAFDYFKIAADLGHTDAQINTAILYSLGKGVEKSDKKAITYYNKALESGEKGVSEQIAMLYLIGDNDIEQNYVMAYTYFLVSKKMGKPYPKGEKIVLPNLNEQQIEEAQKKSDQIYSKISFTRNDDI